MTDANPEEVTGQDGERKIPASAKKQPMQDLKTVINGGSIPVGEFADHLNDAARRRLQEAAGPDGKANDYEVVKALTSGVDSSKLPQQTRNSIHDLRTSANREDGGDVSEIDTRSGANRAARDLDKDGDGAITRCDLPAPGPNSTNKKDVALYAKLCRDAGIERQSFNPQEHGAGTQAKGNEVRGEGVEKPAPAQGATATR